MLLGVDILLSLVNDPEVKLVENLSERELTNPEGAGFDLRVDSIYELAPTAGHLGVTDRETPEALLLGSQQENPEQAVLLEPQAYYLIQTMETTNIPLGLVGLVQPRSTLFRSGLVLAYSQVNPGYSGTLTFGLLNAGATAFTLEMGARVAHLMIATVSGETSGYRGQWQGGRVWAEREAQV